jgi:hypothetical protein
VNPIQQAEQALDAFLTGDLTPYAAAQAIDSLRSLQKEVEGVELPKFPLHDVAATAPGVVWLNIFGVESDYESGFPEDHEGITWCESEVGDLDVPYVRVDRVAAVAAALGRGAVPHEYLAKFIGKGNGMVRRFYNGEAQSVNDAGDWMQEAMQLLQLKAAAPSPEATQPTQAEAPLYMGACITDGRLHATVMRHEPGGHVTVVAMAEMDVASLQSRDCATRMTAPTPEQPTQAEELSEVCKRCKGRGTEGDHDGERYVEVVCDRCGGTGRAALATQPTASPEQAEAPSERGKISVTVEGLRSLAGIAKVNGKSEEFFQVALEWAEKASAEILRLRAALATQQAVQGELAGFLHKSDPSRFILASVHADFMREPGANRSVAEQYTQPVYTATPPAPGQVERDREDSELLDWLTEQLVDTIYLDDGRIIDVGTGRIGLKNHAVSPHDVRSAIRAARSSEGGGNA